MRVIAADSWHGDRAHQNVRRGRPRIRAGRIHAKVKVIAEMLAYMLLLPN